VLLPLSRDSRLFGTRFVLSPHSRLVAPHQGMRARWGRTSRPTPKPRRRRRPPQLLEYDSCRDHIARRNELFALLHEKRNLFRIKHTGGFACRRNLILPPQPASRVSLRHVQSARARQNGGSDGRPYYGIFGTKRVTSFLCIIRSGSDRPLSVFKQETAHRKIRTVSQMRAALRP
jgi:hypothetical protein